MLEKAESEEYLNYSWVRDMFELMVLNALVFNRFVSFEEVAIPKSMEHIILH